MTCGRLFIIYYFRGTDLYNLVAAVSPPPSIYLFGRIGDGGGRAWFLEKTRSTMRD